MNHNHCYRDKPEIPNNHSYSDRPTLTFRPFIENNPKVRLKWNTTSLNGCLFFLRIDGSETSTRKLNPCKANILSLMWSVPIGRPMRKDLNVACIVYSNERQKCTAASFRMGRPIGTLHIKDKIFALQGFSFRVEANILSLMWSVPIGRPMRKDAAVHFCLSLLYTMQATFNCSCCYLSGT
jgi:hypothetical protein